MTERSAQERKIQAPRGTRDLYPAEAARRRWLLERWREVSIRHGFEEVDGPTFETSELYAVKSGDAILGELFQAFSGKSPDEVERVKESGRGPYALRPEFTPTLARMYAAKANGLPKPCKWFMAGPFFRAERPQRGRLREFLQWNVDVLGLDIPPELWSTGSEDVAAAKARMDAECIGCCVAFLRAIGLNADDVTVRFNNREIVQDKLVRAGIRSDRHEQVLAVIDASSKLSSEQLDERLQAVGVTRDAFELVVGADEPEQLSRLRHPILQAIGSGDDASRWIEYDPRIVRGLAYYTGTVFEVIADGERAVAGGGRYDNLVELFGGPSTPAVGFAMGDVVLSLLLQDKGLMPSDAELMGLVGQSPDAFVLSNGTGDAEAMVVSTVAALRASSLHARHSYKTSKNIGKLLKEAAQQGARFAIIIESGDACSVKDLASGEQWEGRVPIDGLSARLTDALRA